MTLKTKMHTLNSRTKSADNIFWLCKTWAMVENEAQKLKQKSLDNMPASEGKKNREH